MTDHSIRLGAERVAAERSAVEEAAFHRLYASMAPSVFQFAVRRLSPEQAKDVVNDTFEVVWRKRRHLPVDDGAWAAWVIGIARNKVRQETARQRRREPAAWPPAPRDGVAEGVAEAVLDSLASRDVYRQLSDDERELFDLAHLRSLTPRDGAAVLGISVSAYTTRVSRLRGRIVSLAKEPAGPDG